jgi:hypothetical protein
VCVERRGWLYSCVGCCNSPLNNKNIGYHCPVVFSRIRFPHKSLFQLCDCCSQFISRFYSSFCFRCLTSLTLPVRYLRSMTSHILLGVYSTSKANDCYDPTRELNYYEAT